MSIVSWQGMRGEPHWYEVASGHCLSGLALVTLYIPHHGNSQ